MLVALALVVALALLLALSAGPARAGSGGAVFVPTPKVAAVKCVASCASKGRLRSGSRLSLRGKGLRGVTRVVFLGVRGKRDDVAVAASATSDRRASAVVPFAAQSGPVAAASPVRRSKPSRPLTIVPPPEPEPSAELRPVPGPQEPGAPLIETATNRAKFYLGVRGGIRFSYRVSDPNVSVAVTLVRENDGTVVQTWTPASAPAGEIQNLSWDGTIRGQSAPEGRYAFRIAARGASGAQARSAQASTGTRDSFDLYGHVFPIRGKHNYGQSGARFGAGRSGHSHQGQDVMAACGTKLVAARGGRVKAKQYHSRAGNYIVIDGAGTGTDYAYMHLAQPSPLAKGERVYTGQQIGVVGTTGSSTACHLHFEEWSAPGWYTGGRPFDPLADLLAWDANS